MSRAIQTPLTHWLDANMLQVRAAYQDYRLARDYWPTGDEMTFLEFAEELFQHKESA